MNELITVFVCVLKKVIWQWVENKHNNSYKQKTSKLTPFVAPPNQELQQLKKKKKQIQDTMEQFNSPSTFAKYSKMQREVLKINKTIQTLLQSTQSQLGKQKQIYQQKRAQQQKQFQQQQKKYQTTQKIMRIIVSIILFRVLSKLKCSYCELTETFPFSILSSQGQIGCQWLMLAISMIL